MSDHSKDAKRPTHNAPKAPVQDVSTFLRGHITLVHVGDRRPRQDR